MRTVQILLQLKKTIQNNPTSISAIPWSDVRLCVHGELDILAPLYEDARYASVAALYNELCDHIESDAANNDIYSLFSHMDCLIFSLQSLPTADYAVEQITRGNFANACLKHHKENTIIVLGDSHVNFFSGNELLNFVPIGKDINVCPQITSYPFTALHLGPCLAYNSRRHETTYRFREKLEFLCDTFIRPGATVVCCLGEIDLRVHVMKQCALQSKSYQSIVDEIADAYLPTLLFLKECGYRAYCWGPIASQTDNCPEDPSFPRNGSEIERNMATAYFNDKMYDLCQKHEIHFMSIFRNMITEDYRTITEYLSADCCHLGQNALPLAVKAWQDSGLLSNHQSNFHSEI